MNLNNEETTSTTRKAKSNRIARRPSSGLATTSNPSRRANRAEKESQTRITAKVDVGFGNALFIRGRGEGLSWEQGTPLTCHDSDNWVWAVGTVNERIVFKLLLNDQIWAQGQDHVVDPGTVVEVRPSF